MDSDTRDSARRQAGNGRLTALALLLALGALSSGADCRRDAGHSPASSTDENSTTTPANDTTSQPAITRAADGDDDADAPRSFPRSYEVQGWVKTSPVKILAGALASESVGPAMAEIMRDYRVNRVSRSEYTSPTAGAEVVLIEAAGVDDAFGLYSVATSQAGCTMREDGSLRHTDEGEAVTFIGWQGQAVARVRMTSGTEAAARKNVERLFARVLFAQKAAEPPLLVEAVHDFAPKGCTAWMVRRARLLGRADQPILKRVDASRLDALLNLNGEAMLSIVAVPNKDAPATVGVIWVVQYPTGDAARQAKTRYEEAVKAAASPLDKRTMIGPVKGRYLTGTWTAEQEPARDALKMLEQVLPAE